jgi:protein subunit release factor A
MNPAYLKTESFPTRRPGGQSVGVLSTGVIVTHIPTGISATCNAERSQFKNRKIAMAMIEYGLAEMGWKE